MQRLLDGGGGEPRFLWGASLWRIFHVGMLALFTFLHVHWFTEAWRETFIQCWCQFASIIAWTCWSYGKVISTQTFPDFAWFSMFLSQLFMCQNMGRHRDFMTGTLLISRGRWGISTFDPLELSANDGRKKKGVPALSGLMTGELGWWNIPGGLRVVSNIFQSKLGQVECRKNAPKFRTEWQDVILRIALTSKELTKKYRLNSDSYTPEFWQFATEKRDRARQKKKITFQPPIFLMKLGWSWKKNKSGPFVYLRALPVWHVLDWILILGNSSNTLWYWGKLRSQAIMHFPWYFPILFLRSF